MSEQEEKAQQTNTTEFGENKTFTPKVTAKSLVAQLSKGKELHDDFAHEFRTKYTIGGKLINEWKQYFRVVMPPDLNPQKCQLLDAKLMELYQEAAFYKAEAESRLSSYKSAHQDRYRTKYAELVADYSKEKGKRLPAKETLVALAEHANSDIINAQVHGEVELAFWKEILNHLTNCRKLLDNATINLGIEAKALMGSNRFDRLGHNEDHVPSFLGDE